jgi:hypothetical protein
MLITVGPSMTETGEIVLYATENVLELFPELQRT